MRNGFTSRTLARACWRVGTPKPVAFSTRRLIGSTLCAFTVLPCNGAILRNPLEWIYVVLPPKDRTPVVVGGTSAFARDMRVERWTVGEKLKLTCLLVQSPKCPEFFTASQPSFADGGFQNPNCFVVDLDRHGI